MPRFFFHIFDDMTVHDDEGLDLPDVEAATRAAIAGAREMICVEVKHGRLHLGHRIEVEDEAGAQVLVLHFGDAVDVERRETGT